MKSTFKILILDNGLFVIHSMKARGRRGSRGGRSGGRSSRLTNAAKAIQTPQKKEGRGRGRRGSLRSRSLGGRSGSTTKKPGISKARQNPRTNTAARGRGRGRPRGRGRATNKRSTRKGLSNAQLDKDLESYFKEDPSFSAKKLDTEMEEYWSHKPTDDEPVDKDT